MSPRFTSIVGALHTPAPDGPQSCAPVVLLPRGFGASGMVYAFQITAPVSASSALTLPRNVQHSYSGRAAEVSSPTPEAVTYNRPSYSVGAPVDFAKA